MNTTKENKISSNNDRSMDMLDIVSTNLYKFNNMFD